ncbi:MAG: type IV pilus modification protein PilV [Methylococcus sp.]
MASIEPISPKRDRPDRASARVTGRSPIPSIGRVHDWRARQAGVGLIEVLVALLVIGIGLLGLAALQGKAQKAELESYQRSEAMIVLQDKANALRANRNGASGMIGDSSVTTLLNGSVCIMGTGNDYVVTVAWQGLAEISTPTSSNPCGSGIPNRRLLSVPVRFFDPGS